jgi:sarcosine oxidase
MNEEREFDRAREAADDHRQAASGLMTAYYAAPLAAAVTVLESSRVGDPATASFGLTRSARNDYLDPQYARLAFEARQLWLELQEKAARPLLIDCGCLNLAKASVTPDLDSTYAAHSFAVLDQLQLRRQAFSPAQLRARFPQFEADGGWLDVDAGFVDVAAATQTLSDAIAARGVRVAEHSAPRAITRSGGAWSVATDAGPVEADVLVVTAGLGTNGVLGLVPGYSVSSRCGPTDASRVEVLSPTAGRAASTQRALPVFAYTGCRDLRPSVV